MNIEQSRTVVRARSFESTRRFHGHIARSILLLSLPLLALPPRLSAQLELGEFVVRKGNLIEVLAPDPSVDLQTLIDDIVDASETNRYLVLLGPGQYVLGSNETLFLKPFVDLAGSGQETTEIVGDGTSGGACGAVGSAVVALAADTVLRDLTVTLDTDDNSNGHVLCNLPDTSPIVRRVTLRSVSDATGGPRYGVYLEGGAPELTDLTVVMNGGSDIFGLYCREDAEVKASRVDLTLTDTVDDNRGIWTVGTCSMDIRDIVAVVDGSLRARGAHIQTGTEIDIHQGRFTVTGPAANIGVLLQGDAKGILYEVRLQVTGGTSAKGIDIEDTSLLRAYRSSIRGTSAAVETSSTVEALIQQSTLLGGVAAFGSMACVASDDGTGSPLDATCM